MTRNLLHLVVILLGTIPSQLANAQESEAKFNRQQFFGWGGIAARCVGEDLPVIERFCSAIARELDFLTATAKIPFIYTGRPKNLLGHLMKVSEAGIKNPLHLRIIVAATKGDDVAALHAQLAAGAFYSDAVETGANKTKPEHYPKSGEFIIWGGGGIVKGPTDELAESLADSFKGFIKEFVTLYIKYRKPIE